MPTLCHMKDHSPTGACRLCMVEVEGHEDLIPSCSHPVEEWMRIKTHSARVIQARKTIVELLLSSHPDDCLFCERNGMCELQDLAEELNIRERRFSGKKNQQKQDIVDSSIIRNPEKCILCERCIRVCSEDIKISAIDFVERGNKMTIGTTYNKGLNSNSCIRCGQCIAVCPTAALAEKTNIPRVLKALHDTKKNVIIHIDPATQLSIAESFNIRNNKDICQLIFTAMHKIGFFHVFDTGTITDIYIEKQAEILKEKILSNEEIKPIFSSFCPSLNYHFQQNNLDSNLSQLKSPQQLAGTLFRNHLIQKEGLDSSNIYIVSVTPCTSRKYEATSQAMRSIDFPETDAVLTTRELLKLIRMHGINLKNIETMKADEPFNIKSSASRMPGLAGGLSEAIIRVLWKKLNGKNYPKSKITTLRNGNGIRQTTIKHNNKEYLFVAATGMNNILSIKEDIEQGRINPLFVDSLVCPNGCFNGGGQPLKTSSSDLKSKIRLVYEIDDKESMQSSDKNPQVANIISIVEKEKNNKEISEIFNR